jgi:subtilisin family serine protease
MPYTNLLFRDAMGSLVVYKTSINPLLQEQGEILIKRRDLIIGFLRKNFFFADKIHLAQVQLKDDTVSFSTDSMGNFKPLEDFTVHEKNELLQRYNKAVYLIEDFFTNYEGESSRSIQQWKAIITKVFNPKYNVLYSDGEHIVLIWGCDFFNDKENFLPRSEVVFDSEEPLTEAQIEEDATTINIEHVAVVHDAPIESTQNDPAPILPTLHSIHVRSNKKSTKSFFNRLSLGLGDFILRGWWFILLLLLLFFWLNHVFCLSCKEIMPFANEERENAQAYLPPRQGVRPPLQPIDIGYDQDSLFVIANNRINVALKEKQEDFYRFVNELGQSFLNEKREIIYYNEETARIQLQFDAASEPNFKDELRRAMPEYALLIWDESIFVSSFQGFNDPFLNQPEKSWYLKMIGMDKAWQITTGNKDIVVAVVDDGFDLNHAELRNTSIVNKYHVIEQRNQVYGTATLSHGTHVSSILLGGANNNQGLLGISPDVSFLPIQIGSQTSPYFTNTDVIDGILYALKNKANVINLSLGKQFSPQIESLPESRQKELIANFGKDEEAFWKELFEIADSQNTTIVIAAGNSGILAGIDPMQRYENAIIVGAVDKRMQLAEFSNYGKYNTVQAPGVQIVSAIPGNAFEAMDGTSMAAPIVAGAVALYKSLHPNATNKEIKNKLVQTARQGGVIQVALFLK